MRTCIETETFPRLNLIHEWLNSVSDIGAYRCASSNSRYISGSVTGP